MSIDNSNLELDANKIRALEEGYRGIYPVASSFGAQVKTQIEQLIAEKKIYPTVPLQYRVKEWSSISEKIRRKSLMLETITNLTDLVGVRLILQFSRDIEIACQSIEQNFNILEKFNTQDRLEADQFGYASTHLIVKLKAEWLSVPSFKGMEDIIAEIQVRTTAQHIWASASHLLQYKQESSIPIPVRRAIHRVSALLETVDLEFERALDAREKYIAGVPNSTPDEELNVDLVEIVLDIKLPPQNKEPNQEDYSTLVTDLFAFGIKNRSQLEGLIDDGLNYALISDKEYVGISLEDDDEDVERASRGVYFNHTGLARAALQAKFGSKFSRYQTRKFDVS